MTKTVVLAIAILSTGFLFAQNGTGSGESYTGTDYEVYAVDYNSKCNGCGHNGYWMVFGFGGNNDDARIQSRVYNWSVEVRI